MDLTLTIIEAPHNVNMINHTKAFPAEGGSLGRADNNDWVLPDYERVVSSRHADICFQHGRFYLTDRSTNGTFHNHSDQAIGPGQSVPLEHGDIVALGDYRLKVSIKQPQPSPHLPKGLQPADFLDSADKTLFANATPAEHKQLSQLQDLDDWLDPDTQPGPLIRTAAWGSAGAHVSTRPMIADAPVQPRVNDPLTALGVASESPTPSSCIDPLAALDQASAIALPSPSLWADDDDWWQVGSDNDHAPALSQAMHTPAIHTPTMPPSAQIPEPEPEPRITAISSMWDNQPHLHNIAVADVDEARGIMSAAPVSPTPVTAPLQPQPVLAEPKDKAPQHSSPAAQALPDALAAALGIDQLSAGQRAQLIPEVAAIVNETVNRLIDLLRARSSIKNELRVQRTIIQMLDNNPLKFSVSAQDTIKNMFTSDNPAFLRPGDAISASFDDLSDHQVAVLAGMRSGYNAMLKHFDPATLDQRFNHSSSLLSNKKAKNWEAFEQYYAMLKQDGESSYDLLFGDSFSASYEQQLAELQTARHLTRRRE